MCVCVFVLSGQQRSHCVCVCCMIEAGWELMLHRCIPCCKQVGAWVVFCPQVCGAAPVMEVLIQSQCVESICESFIAYLLLRRGRRRATSLSGSSFLGQHHQLRVAKMSDTGPNRGLLLGSFSRNRLSHFGWGPQRCRAFTGVSRGTLLWLLLVGVRAHMKCCTQFGRFSFEG